MARIVSPLQSKVRVSGTQLRLWLAEQRAADAGDFNTTVAWRTTGDVSRERLAIALSAVVNRHETLRTGFEFGAGELWQVVHDAAVPAVSDCTAATREEADAAINAFKRQPFELAKPPLVRACVLRVGATEKIIAISFHRLVFDGWSRGVLARDLAAAYETAGFRDVLVELAPLEEQYRDAVTRREAEAERERSERLAFWADALAGLPEPGVAGGDATAREEWRTISPALNAGIVGQAQRRATTPFVLYLTGYALAFVETTGLEDVVVGVPFANRFRRSEREILGMFADAVPVRLRLRRGMDLDAAWSEVHARARDALGWRPFSLVEVIEAAKLGARAWSLFDTHFVYDNSSADPLVLDGVPAERYSLHVGVSPFAVIGSIEELYDTACAGRDMVEGGARRRGGRALCGLARSPRGAGDMTLSCGLKLTHDGGLALVEDDCLVASYEAEAR